MATVPTMDTFVAGEKLTAAKMNKNVRDAMSFLLNPPRASMRRITTGFSMAAATHVPIEFNSETLDTDGMIDIPGSSPTAITIKTAGTYDILGQVSWVNNAVNSRGARITINDGPIAIDYRFAASSLSTVIQVSALSISLVVGDQIRLTGWHNSTTTPLLTSVGTGEHCFLSARWVAA